jgi:hypothetical protein
MSYAQAKNVYLFGTQTTRVHMIVWNVRCISFFKYWNELILLFLGLFAAVLVGAHEPLLGLLAVTIVPLELVYLLAHQLVACTGGGYP